MTLLWLFIYNLKIPFMLLTVATIACCYLAHKKAEGVQDRTKFSEMEHTDARWVQRGAIQLGAIIAFVCAMVLAVPSPTYNIRTVVQTVHIKDPRAAVTITKTIRKPLTYTDTYDRCFADLKGGTAGLDASSRCQEVALLADPRRVIVRTIRIPSTYQTNFNICIDGMKNSIRIEDPQTKLCHTNALEATYAENAGFSTRPNLQRPASETKKLVIVKEGK